MVSGDKERFPYRLVVRHLNAMQQEVTLAMIRAGAGGSERVVLLLAIMREAYRRSGQPVRSVNALAASFERPFESVRRHMRELAAAGLVRREADGFHVTDAPVIEALRRQIDEAVLQLVRALERAGVTLTDDGRPYDAPPEARLALGMDLMLAIVHVPGPHDGNWTALKILGGVQTLSVRHIMADPRLDQRYARNEDVPPDEVRRPVTIAELAARFGLSHATVWRHVRGLEKKGALKRMGGGYIAPEAWFAKPEQQAITRDLVLAAMNRLRASARQPARPSGGALPADRAGALQDG